MKAVKVNKFLKQAGVNVKTFPSTTSRLDVITVHINAVNTDIDKIMMVFNKDFSVIIAEQNAMYGIEVYYVVNLVCGRNLPDIVLIIIAAKMSLL